MGPILQLKLPCLPSPPLSPPLLPGVDAACGDCEAPVTGREYGVRVSVTVTWALLRGLNREGVGGRGGDSGLGGVMHVSSALSHIIFEHI